MDKSLTVRTADLITAAKGTRPIAQALGITTQAVYSWGDHVPILRVFQLKELHPEWFKKGKK